MSLDLLLMGLCAVLAIVLYVYHATLSKELRDLEDKVLSLTNDINNKGKG